MPPRRIAPMAAAALGLAVAFAFFASRPPMRVLVGTTPLDAFVPAHYQAAVFPAFAAFATSLAQDALLGRGRGTWAPRAALVAVAGALSVVRLAGALPLSGHALFLAAVLAYDLPRPRREGAPEALLLAAAGMGVTAYAKLVIWGDARWFAASVVAGGVLGLACRARAW